MTLCFLLISGSLRATSTNTAALRTLAAVAPDHVTCRLYDELADLPAFNPDADRLSVSPEVDRLRQFIHDAHAIVFSAPEYAGALPGSFKNLLDWAIGDDHADSIYEKPVGWINPSPRGAVGAYAELGTVLGYAHARVVEAACVQLSIAGTMVGSNGLITDRGLRSELVRLAETLAANVISSMPETE